MSTSRWICLSLPLWIGCATPGAVVEKTPISAPLGGYPSAALVMVAADPSATNAAMKVTACRRAFEAKLNASGVFGSVLNEEKQAEAALVIKGAFTDQTQSTLGIEEKHKRILVAVDFIDNKTSGSIGAVDAQGTSDTGSTTRVGGVDTDAFATDLYDRACAAAAEEFGNYVKTKK